MDDLKIKGGKELQQFLDQLPAKIERNILRSALRQGANEIKEEAKRQLASNGSIKTGVLADGLKVSTNAKNGKIKASLKARGKHAYIANWLEFTGAAPHIITPKKKKALKIDQLEVRSAEHPGFRPKPFMRPALEGKSAAAIQAVGEAVKKRLTKQGIDASDTEFGVEE